MAEYPDDRIELRADGAALPYTTYDRLAEIDQGAILEHKRMGQVQAIAGMALALRDDRHAADPSRTLSGESRSHTSLRCTSSASA